MALTANDTPPRAPSPLITPASIKNCARIVSRRAPTTFLTPISRVRSVTDTSITFMMPIPLTSNAMNATARSVSVSTAEIFWAAARRPVRFSTWYRASRRCRLRRTSAKSRVTLATASALDA